MSSPTDQQGSVSKITLFGRFIRSADGFPRLLFSFRGSRMTIYSFGLGLQVGGKRTNGRAATTETSTSGLLSGIAAAERERRDGKELGKKCDT